MPVIGAQAPYLSEALNILCALFFYAHTHPHYRYYQAPTRARIHIVSINTESYTSPSPHEDSLLAGTVVMGHI